MKNWSKLGFEAKTSRSTKVVIDYNSMMGRLDMSDAYLISYCSTRKG
jgi:hypothetical protein